MSKTITLRLSDEEYEKFAAAAGSVKRSISNLISFLALSKLEEDALVDGLEMEEIMTNSDLVQRLRRGSEEAAAMKGSFVDV